MYLVPFSHFLSEKPLHHGEDSLHHWREVQEVQGLNNQIDIKIGLQESTFGLAGYASCQIVSPFLAVTGFIILAC